ncbi:MAG: UvrD-helicase domain-containing protein [Candidatus Vogelbacteria bacterium]|nr:UvrD-helicase domain-containing protein [Candidatus Vogelbacteria bacterium]
MMNYLIGLNERQKEAVLHKDGPLLIVAGAGAGKTKTITHRIAHLIAGGVNSNNILAVTFTNKAAKEMRDRVNVLLSQDETKSAFDANPPRDREQENALFVSSSPNAVSGSPLISTFHSLGVQILKENANTLGISRYFSILNKDESLSLIKKCAKEVGLSPKEFSGSAVQAVISREKNKLITPDKFEVKTENHYFGEMAHGIWEKYEKKMREQKAFDFDDLIAQPVFLLRSNDRVREFYQSLWKYIHIDEYQDTNMAQYELSKLLAEKHRNICVVGDSDQAIYGWRQADYRNILNFEKNFPGTKTILLEENYRSTKNILDAANEIIKKNKQRKEKNLFTSRREGQKILVYGAFDESDEARFVTSKVKEILADKTVHPEEIAVLYRANFQSRILEEKFLKSNIQYQVLGVRFYERKEVKDVVALIKYAVNTEDLQSMERIINVPPRGIGDVSFNKIISGRESDLPLRLQERLREFRQMTAKAKEILLSNKLSDSIKKIIELSGMDKGLKTEEDGEDRIENLKELVTIATKYDFLTPEEALDKFLTETALLSDQDSLTEQKNGVKLMTVHASKGLEFKYVFVTGLEEDLFPHRSIDPRAENDPEEERRLFYVAITRAKDRLFISYANMRTIYGSKKINMPSRFLGDIKDDVAEFKSNNVFDSFGSAASGQNKEEDIVEWDCLK